VYPKPLQVHGGCSHAFLVVAVPSYRRTESAAVSLQALLPLKTPGISILYRLAASPQLQSLLQLLPL
jgi:hypothetical protein